MKQFFDSFDDYKKKSTQKKGQLNIPKMYIFSHEWILIELNLNLLLQWVSWIIDVLPNFINKIFYCMLL